MNIGIGEDMAKLLAGRIGSISALILLTAWVSQSVASPILTPAGVAQGFTLSQFAFNFPTASCCGPLGIAFPASGGVMVTDYPGNVRVFPTDTDGQNAATVPVGQNYGFSNAVGLTRDGSAIYMTQQFGNQQLVQVNNNGTFNQVIASGLNDPTGIVTDPANGDVFVSDCCDGGHIWLIDPIAKTVSVFKSGFTADGLTITPDGSTLYAEVGGHILGFNTGTGTQVFDSGSISGADGTALGFGSLAGDIFVNTNFGQVVEVNLTTLAQTVIVNSGTRGDFVTADPNGSLLFTQSTDIWRLTPASGGCIGNQCGTAPEPATLGLVGLALAAFAFASRRRRPL